jgi:DNA repair exonuclease SbcCD ATPase subunit
MSEAEEARERIIQQLREDETFDIDDIEECQSLLEEPDAATTADNRSVQLNRIFVRHFKALNEEEEVIFDREDTVITGRNTRGKTSLVEAIRFNLLGLHENQRVKLVDPVTEGYDTLYTDGFWQVNGDEYLIHRELTDSGAYVDHDEPKLVENPDGRDIPFGMRDSQVDVSELIGLWPYEQRDLGRYNMFSLFFLASDQFKTFVDWQENPTFLDLIFGLNLTKVVDASKKKRQDVYELTDDEETAAEDFATAEDLLYQLETDIGELRERQQEVQGRLNQRKDELSTVQEVLSGENELEQLRSEKSRLNRRINTLDSERLEKESERRSIQRQISVHQESELSREIEPLAADLREVMSLPDRCPICTNDVTAEQARQLLDHGNCPLCEKEVPDDRIEIESEIDSDEQIIEQQERREELERLQDRERTLDGEITQLRRQVADLNEQVEEIDGQIAETDLTGYAERRDELEALIPELEQEATSLQVDINAKEKEVKEVREDVARLNALKEDRDVKTHKQQMLQTFEKVVRAEIQRARQSIQEELESIMNELLEHLQHGLFADATGVSFKSEKAYNFTIYREYGENKPSDRQNADSVEGLIQSLLFQTAVLQYLDITEGLLPIRVFIIDSPYSKEPDEENAKDITSLLSALPSELENYQIIVTVATTALVELDEYEGNYDILEF